MNEDSPSLEGTKELQEALSKGSTEADTDSLDPQETTDDSELRNLKLELIEQQLKDSESQFEKKLALGKFL